jgi:predicted TIM-barrel fold metal-dependent hydrolase
MCSWGAVGAYQSITKSIADAEKSKGHQKNLAYLKKNILEVQLTNIRKSKHSVIDIHEHVLNEKEALRLLKVMDHYGIQLTCLMGTSRYTFTLNNQHGFEGWRKNNEELLRIKKKYPKRFCVFVTIDPRGKGNLELLQDYVKRGADGLKLYLGHGGKTGKEPFHVMDLDDERMRPIYSWAQGIRMPIIMHVNLIKYYDEFSRMMSLYPKLKVCIPHFGLHKNTQTRLDKLAGLFDKYPHLYSDIGFGWEDYHTKGFESLSKWRSRSKAFLSRYADRFMYSSDMVIEPYKSVDYIYDTLGSYFHLLETKRFRFFREPVLPMHGLDLDDQTLINIYQKTPGQFLGIQ